MKQLLLQIFMITLATITTLIAQPQQLDLYKVKSFEIQLDDVMELIDTNFGLQDSDIKSIVKILLKNPLINEAYIFGSRAKGNFKKGSDVDIALKAEISIQTSYQK